MLNTIWVWHDMTWLNIKSLLNHWRVMTKIFWISVCTEVVIIAQVYRLSAVHCQMTRYSQRVPGYFTRYSVSVNETPFDKKNQPIRLCLSNQVRPGSEWFPSPLGDFNRLFEGPVGELFKIWHWNMFYFFKRTSVWPLKCEFVSLLCWLKQAECSVHFTIQQSDNLNTQSTVLTNSSIMVASVVYGEWRWQPYQNLLNSVYPLYVC